jgi:t-SNARE complex subunit (syntaxin)
MMKAEFIELEKMYKNQGIFKSDTVILAEVVEKMMTTGFDKVHANMAQLLQLVSVMSDLISKMERRIDQLEQDTTTVNQVESQVFFGVD